MLKMGSDEKVDIVPIMKALHEIAAVEVKIEPKVDKVNKVEVSNSKEEKVIELNQYDKSVIKQANEKGYNAINIRITLSENTLLKSARAFLIVKDLEEAGEIVKSIPATEDIENEEFDFELTFLLITENSETQIKSLVENISEVRGVEVKTIVIEDEVLEEKVENT